MSDKNIHTKEEFVPPFDAIKVAYYRGIGSEQIIGPLGQMNVFIGENNAGKSIVLNLVHDCVKDSLKGKEIDLSPEEKYRDKKGQRQGSFSSAVGTKTNNFLQNPIRKLLDGDVFRSLGVPFVCEEDKENFIEQASQALGGYFWVEKIDAQEQIIRKVFEEHLKAFENDKVQNICNRYLGGFSPDKSYNIRKIFDRFFGELSFCIMLLSEIRTDIFPKTPEVRMISDIRNISLNNENRLYLNGAGLIKKLKPIVHATYDCPDDLKKSQKINHFLQRVIGKKKVELKIPHNDTIEVEIEGKRRPLETLGTGIKEVVIIAAYCTIYDGDIICIEEPEIHLHPKLQRQLVRYLIKNTTSQYFIATHSNIFIDIPEANLFRVSNDGVETHIEHLPDAIQKRGVLDDLGYLASDLWQTNYIIWVEGPSDRIYLRHWISLIDDDLQEGIDYSIMFYGGALIKYLSVSDEENETINEQEFSDFIKLLQINRNMTILMDRDCPHNQEKFKPAVRRIKKELEDKDSSEAFWVTHGREVENYVDKGKIQEVIKSNHSGSYKEAPADLDQLNSHLFQYLSTGAKKRKEDSLLDADKIKLANKICETSPSLDNFCLDTDLQKKVKTLVKRIKKANGIEIKGDDLPK